MLHGARTLLAAAGFAWAAMITTAHAAEIRLLASTAMREALDALVPQFEKESGHKVAISFYPAATLVLKVKDNAPADIVMTTPDNLASLTDTKHLVEGTRVDFVHSRVGVAVKAGAPKPDISTVEGFKNALLHARSITYPSSTTGIYMAMTLFPRLGIADTVIPKSSNAGIAAVAKGDAEIAIQPVSELLHVSGTDFVGTLPKEIQYISVFSAARVAGSTRSGEAEKLIAFLGSAKARDAIRNNGMEPLPAH